MKNQRSGAVFFCTSEKGDLNSIILKPVSKQRNGLGKTLKISDIVKNQVDGWLSCSSLACYGSSLGSNSNSDIFQTYKMADISKRVANTLKKFTEKNFKNRFFVFAQKTGSTPRGRTCCGSARREARRGEGEEEGAETGSYCRSRRGDATAGAAPAPGRRTTMTIQTGNPGRYNLLPEIGLKGLSHDLVWAFDDIMNRSRFRISVATGFIFIFLMSLRIFMRQSL
jgi:hypothetical protein